MASTQASLFKPSKKLKLTLIPPRKPPCTQLFEELTKDDDDIQTPSPIAKSSSPSSPNAPSKTPSTKGTSFNLGTASSSFKSRPNSSPFSSRTTPSPQPTNPFIDNPMDVPKKFLIHFQSKVIPHTLTLPPSLL
uniref:Uncharacterized protein n=1 Tax=Tanacetum cinerariifolium TaxID=118510 RepID=A0A699J7P0_TANCI|nr:hypothetical protein [Tanacetum cinerariifolium]